MIIFDTINITKRALKKKQNNAVPTETMTDIFSNVQIFMHVGVGRAVTRMLKKDFVCALVFYVCFSRMEPCRRQ